MCSVVGYVGSELCRSFIMKGLERLEYRGYDSAGFACLDAHDRQLVVTKALGELAELAALFQTNPVDGYCGIGHTRWSTHGKPSTENAHPHADCNARLSVVHNGIIENHHALKQQLRTDGHRFSSETDTEVVAHLLEVALREYGPDMRQALCTVVNQLEGAFAFVGITQDCPDLLFAVRKGSPLCIGIGAQHMFVASDIHAFAGQADRVLFLPEASCALVRKDQIELFDFTGRSLCYETTAIPASYENNGKDGNEHYMLKEIYEQKRAIQDTIAFFYANQSSFWSQTGLELERVQQLETIHIVACGSSWHAARIAQFYFEQICLIPTLVSLASEFRYMSFFAKQHCAYIFVSQSGETADTLEALRMVRDMGLPTIALTNVASSTMVREADGFLLTHAGPEVAVASTKAFATQLAALYWFAHALAHAKGLIGSNALTKARDDLFLVAQLLESTLECYSFQIVHKHAPFYAQFKKFIFLGRNISYPFAMEAALKLKEISYIFAQCYPAGELKHGPLALIDEQTPVFVISTCDQLLYQKLVLNAQEVKARGGHVVAFAFEHQQELCELADVAFVIPQVPYLLGPLAAVGLMQFLVYRIAKELGCSIDKPRNLAKSVTVE